MNIIIIYIIFKRKIIVPVLSLLTLLLVTLNLIPVKQPQGEVRQREYSSVLKYLIFKAYQDHVAKQEESNKPIVEKNLLSTIQDQAINATCLPIELVIYNRKVHVYHDFEKIPTLTQKESNEFYHSNSKKAIARRNRYSAYSDHYNTCRLFRTDRLLDLTFESYLPLSRVMRKADAASKNDVQLCLDYLPNATPKERALIFISFYIYIEKLYKDGTRDFDEPNRLNKMTQRFVNKLLSAMRENTTSDEVAFYANQADLAELANLWQVSFRRLFWNLIQVDPAEPVFLSDSLKPWIEVTLDSPDTFLYSLALVQVNSTMHKTPQPYRKMTQYQYIRDVDTLDDIFTSRTDTPLSYSNGFGSCETYQWYRARGSYKPVPDPRIESALFYPQRSEILTSYTNLLLPEENLADEAREYLLAQFFFLRIGYMRCLPTGSMQESYNDVANKYDITVGEVATRLLDEIHFITTPVSAEEVPGSFDYTETD